MATEREEDLKGLCIISQKGIHNTSNHVLVSPGKTSPNPDNLCQFLIHCVIIIGGYLWVMIELILVTLHLFNELQLCYCGFDS